MPEIDLDVYKFDPETFDPDNPDVESGKLQLNTTVNPPTIKGAQVDIDAIPDGAVAYFLIKVRFGYIRAIATDTATQNKLSDAAVNAFDGIRQKLLNRPEIIDQTEADQLALMTLAELIQGKFSLEFQIRTTLDWYPPQQIECYIPAQNKIVLLVFTRISTDPPNELPNGLDEFVHKITAELFVVDPLATLTSAVQLANNPIQKPQIQLKPDNEMVP